MIPQDASNTAGVVPAGYWNSSTDAGLNGDVILSDSTLHPINVSLSGVTAPHTQIAGPANDDQKLMGSSYDSHEGLLTLGVSGLPAQFTAQGYDVYVYLWGTDDPRQQGPYQVDLDLGQDNVDDGVPAVFFDQNFDTFSGFDNNGQSTNSGDASSANYVKIASVGQGQSSFDVDVNGSEWVVINGFQVVAVPEPAVTLFLVSGGAVLASRRRRVS